MFFGDTVWNRFSDAHVPIAWWLFSQLSIQVSELTFSGPISQEMIRQNLIIEQGFDVDLAEH